MALTAGRSRHRPGERAFEKDVVGLARHIATLSENEESKVFHLSWWTERLLDWAMTRPSFKTQLFRLVDVFPATTGDADVLRHVTEYFDGIDVPKALDLGIASAARVPYGRSATAKVARRNILRLAEQFIVGSTPAEAVAGLHQLWRQGTAFTVDLLGEKTLLESEADVYASRVQQLLEALVPEAEHWAPDAHLERDDLGAIPRVNVSVKPTALATHYEPLTRELGLEQAKRRLRPLLRFARDHRAHVHFDMEHDDVKELTLSLFYDLLDEDEFADVEAGVVIQAYLRDSYRDLSELVHWASDRAKPVTVRLVKGAYWDAETIHSSAAGWHAPVYSHKVETDANYERCTRLLHDRHGAVRAAFATHNLRSLAYAITYARSLGIPDTGYEIQMLYGMAEPIHAAIRRLGMRLRVYTPMGELVPGMAYLVRRLLENTSNESFVRQRFADHWKLDDLLAAPRVTELPDPAPPARRSPTDALAPSPYQPEPVAEWRREPVRHEFSRAVSEAGARDRPWEVPALIGGEWVMTASSIDSPDPGSPQQLVARSASCGSTEVDAAVDAAARASAEWRRTPVAERSAVSFRAAEWMRARRFELAALEVFEAGKPWDQADADVCEAIDFCEYYGREMLRLAAADTDRVQSPAGETNVLQYRGKGVAAVISPWNFPLAIPCGMVSAALVAGNTVVLKPAEQTPAVARRLVDAYLAAGLPPGVLQFLPGPGETAGARLVEHPDVNVIAFTGSAAVGLEINRVAAIHRDRQRHVKRVIAEMGGKNAVIVDADADPDVAIPAIINSAFLYSGQKCSAASRLIVLDPVYDTIVDRLVGMAGELVIGHPSHMATQVGPLIDRDAQAKVQSYVSSASTHGTVLLSRDDLPPKGWYAGPTIVGEVDPGSPLAREEIFGPVLSVLRARDIEHAIELANDTDFALTAGIFSRLPSHIALATAELRAGNVYVNRAITAAVVGRQPFGGYGRSGVGSKAGGPDYLLQFLDPRVVTENTVRQGFAPGQ
ncbi:MAG: bifunctional proline dehydrogenase/L-glutamate gamma-semialdehyde dehydrogenase [Actinobacteria bacterium]|nr:bifunctional proline dehydrogenase/L-glutamate gamma-semialdehyde dehydrogenase [Actinomycetota bacterium]